MLKLGIVTCSCCFSFNVQVCLVSVNVRTQRKSSKQFFVFIDVEAPNISCHRDLSVEADEDRPTARLTWRTPKTSDNSGNVPDVSCKPRSNTDFTIGQTVVTCVAVDGGGNRNNCRFLINVTGDYSMTFSVMKATTNSS